MAARGPWFRLALVVVATGLGVLLGRYVDQRVGTGVVVLALVENLALLAGMLIHSEDLADIFLPLGTMTITSFGLHLVWDPRHHESPEALLGGLILLLTLGLWRVIFAVHRF